MSNKKTAVEWILDKLAPYIYYPYAHSSGYDVEELIEQAKAMEKEQEFETKAYWFGRGILASKENRVHELKPKK